MTTSARTHLLNNNSINAAKHMLETAMRHPYITTGVALGASYAVARFHNQDNRPEAPNPGVYQSGKSQANPSAMADFTGSAVMPPPVMAGLDTASPAHIQLNGAGYEGGPGAEPSALQSLALEAPPMQQTFSSGVTGRMSAMSNSRYRPSNSAINNIIDMNNA